MKSLTVAVVCSECGKKLRGHIGVMRGFHVSKHKNAEGKPCWGARKVDHKRVES